MNLIKIKGIKKEEVEVEVSLKDLGYQLVNEAYKRCDIPDGKGWDWVTDDKGNTYIGGHKNWKISSDPFVAKLVDVGNFFIYGEEFKLEELSDEESQGEYDEQ
ncbi:hypothetical protein NW801_22095 [Brevibacillus laterosporus]|uniref:Phage protein n=1 Tax=Brevibacillus halotolerans TaxID=1507437 RepID=A0ABT4I2Z8_9BACL|nr:MULTISPECIES: hypothetical protein [Brevibacillus]MCR8987685.1 hypothetical protein [Brevibacillus laterosporus]MCZ0833424.1 hypothetical protein [Brevibacillus halotolerans]